MRIYLGSDHAGFQLKSHLISKLNELGHDVVDCGAHTYAPDDDYPPFITDTARRTVADPGSFGIVIGGSGNGEAMAANKVRGARAALVWNIETARLAREHNDANIISIGARQHTLFEAAHLVDAFLSTSFSHDPKHARRIQMLDEAIPTPPTTN
ncbi:ribose-5-phosphate isomerase [Streptomyces klenkii]|uniref:ribose-5-phosphate isomerase n=1 Tax=Streptomyces klenkii TaxID=1420899 RepID=UPI003412F9EB